jgi:hypothetical protein
LNRLFPFAAGVLLGFLCGSRQRPPVLIDLAVDVEELASPSVFRRTVGLRCRPLGPVSQGSPQTAC